MAVADTADSKGRPSEVRPALPLQKATVSSYRLEPRMERAVATWPRGNRLNPLNGKVLAAGG
jgi:hypothetical protein